MADPAGALKPAKACIAEQQRKHPPHYPLNSKGFDRAQALCGVLHPDLPTDLRIELDAGTVATGEIGKFEPTIVTVPLGDNNFVIEVCSGLMDFYYDVGKALGGTLVVFSTSPKPDNERALAPEAVAELVVKVYKEWQRYAERNFLSSLFRTDQRFRYADFVLAEPTRGPVEALVTSAELFMLAHELAHVALDTGLRKGETDNDELNADTLGFEWYIPPAQRAAGLRTAYAGATFAVRVTAGLERIGVKFARHYPSPQARLDNLRTLFARSCPSRQFCDEASTIMVAYQDLMDDVDNRLVPGSAPVPDRDRVRIRMIAELQEVAVGRQTRDKLVTDIQTIARSISPDDLRAIFAELHDYYILKAPLESYLPYGTRMRMGGELLACGSKLPDDLRQLAGTAGVLDHVQTTIRNHQTKGAN
jgi:hypothetical protein